MNKRVVVTEKEFAVVINLSGRQRMLSQKMSKELLLIALKVDAHTNRSELKRTVFTFDVVLNRLITGDKDLNIPPPPALEILNQLDKVKSLWEEFKPVVEIGTEDNAISREMIEKVARLNIPLLGEMNTVVGMYEDRSRRAKIKGFGTVVNVAGRQRMLSQKMSKEILLIALKVEPEKNLKSLKDSYTLFELSHHGLIKGDSLMGIPPTFNRDILSNLSRVESRWDDFKVLVEQTINTQGNIHPDLIRKVADLNLKLLTEMDRAVSLYEGEVE